MQRYPVRNLSGGIVFLICIVKDGGYTSSGMHIHRYIGKHKQFQYFYKKVIDISVKVGYTILVCIAHTSKQSIRSHLTAQAGKCS